MDDKEWVIAEIPRNNANEVVRISLGTFKGRSILNIRTWYQSRDGSWKPTRAGVTFPADALPGITEALAGAADRARANGLLSAD
jgi:hypothetical protein